MLAASRLCGAPLHWELGGSHKAIFVYQRLKQQNVFQRDDQPFTEQRLRLQGVVQKDWVRFEAADELSFTFQRVNDSAFPLPDFNPQSFWNATTLIHESRTVRFTNRVDRLNVQLSFDTAELRIGKQVIDEGVGHIFTAVSQVQRYPLVFIDQEFPKTEDAVSFLWKGPFMLEARYLPKVGTQRGDNVHLRAKGNQGGYDLALTGGRSDDKPYVGFEAAGNLGDALLRAEIVGYEWNSRTAGQFLVGFDRVFFKDFNVQVEAFYNGFGALPGNYSFGPLTHRSVPYRGQWYGGMVIAWTISPRWKSSLANVVNVLDPSVLANLVIEFQPRQNLDLIVGQYLGIGGRQSEFGGKLPIPVPVPGSFAFGLPDLTYVEARYYF